MILRKPKLNFLKGGEKSWEFCILDYPVSLILCVCFEFSARKKQLLLIFISRTSQVFVVSWGSTRVHIHVFVGICTQLKKIFAQKHTHAWECECPWTHMYTLIQKLPKIRHIIKTEFKLIVESKLITGIFQVSVYLKNLNTFKN